MRNIFGVLILGVLFVFGATSLKAIDVEVSSLDGMTKGEFLSLKDGKVKIKNDSGEVDIQCGQILSMNFAQAVVASKGKLAVRLINGDILVGEPGPLDKANANEVVLETESLGSLKIPYKSIGGLRSVANFPASVYNNWKPRLNQTIVLYYTVKSGGNETRLPRSDDPDDELYSFLKVGLDEKGNGSISINEKQMGDITKSFEQFRELSTMAMGAEKAKIAAVFNNGDGLKADCLTVMTKDGCRVSLVDIEIKDGVIRGTGMLDGIISLPLDKLVSFKFPDGNFLNLTELEWNAKTAAWHISPVDMGPDGDVMAKQYAPRKNTSVTGKALKLKGVNYSQGFGVHAHTSLPFAVDKKYKEFRAVIGIADEVAQLPGNGVFAKVVFNVHTVKAGKKELVFTKTLTLKDEPAQVKVDLTDVDELILEATYADQLNSQNRANWCNPILIK